MNANTKCNDNFSRRHRLRCLQVNRGSERMEVFPCDVEFVFARRDIFNPKETFVIRGSRKFGLPLVVKKRLELDGSLLDRFFATPPERHNVTSYVRDL